MKLLLLSLLMALQPLLRAQVIGPRIKFDTLEIDFGTLARGSEVSPVWRFVNAGDEDLEIIGVKGSCGCLVPFEWPRNPIRPGEEGEIRAKYDSHRLGPMASGSALTVTTNDPTQLQIRIRIHGKIVPEPIQEPTFSLRPMDIYDRLYYNCGILAQGKGAIVKIPVWNIGQNPLLIDTVESVDKAVEVLKWPTELLENGKSDTIQVYISPQQNGEFGYSIRVGTNEALRWRHVELKGIVVAKP